MPGLSGMVPTIHDTLGAPGGSPFQLPSFSSLLSYFITCSLFHKICIPRFHWAHRRRSRKARMFHQPEGQEKIFHHPCETTTSSFPSVFYSASYPTTPRLSGMWQCTDNGIDRGRVLVSSQQTIRYTVPSSLQFPPVYLPHSLPSRELPDVARDKLKFPLVFCGMRPLSSLARFSSVMCSGVFQVRRPNPVRISVLPCRQWHEHHVRKCEYGVHRPLLR